MNPSCSIEKDRVVPNEPTSERPASGPKDLDTPLLDEQAKEINPDIPQYIVRTPWYLGVKGAPSLRHQRRVRLEPASLRDEEEAYAKRMQPAFHAKTFRRGACTNCGAMTHDACSCVERPRRVGAVVTKTDIRPDEPIMHMERDFGRKRDRWHGYNPEEHR